MSLKTKLFKVFRTFLLKRNYVVASVDTIERLDASDISYAFGIKRKQAFDPKTLPEGAESVLSPTNPKLLELKRKYKELNLFEHTMWKEGYVNSDANFLFFRADNVYIWQARGSRAQQYVISYFDVKNQDDLGLLKKLEEDGMFGAETFTECEDKVLSRDLMDSILEINFLERNTKISQIENLKILDIGAGYGRLAYRMLSGLDNVAKYYCVDGIPESTFFCDYYLNFRNLSPKAVSVPLHQIDEQVPDDTIDLAINIHSFSECSIKTIKWWLDFVARKNIRWLMIIPNTMDQLLSREGDKNKNGEDVRLDFLPEIISRGYSLVTKSTKYRNPVTQKYGLYPGYYFLFERQ